MELVKQEQESYVERFAKEIYTFQRSLAPQLYKNKTQETIKNEIKAIMLLIKDIPENILRVMVNIAIETYADKKSKNKNLQCNIDFVLAQYENAKMLARMGLTCWEDCYDDIDKIEI